MMSVTLAIIFTILATTQLYRFEDFPDVIASFWLPDDMVMDRLAAALLVTFEVLAIPFLLFMRLSTAMRIVSMITGWAVVIGWLMISFWVNLTVNAVTNSGVLGATISIAPGWWMTGLFVILGAMVAWVSWRMMFAPASIDTVRVNKK
jgi:hypothetical protein